MNDVTDPFIIMATLLYDEKDWISRLSPYIVTAEQRKLIEQIEQLDALAFTGKETHGELHKFLHPFSDEALQLFAVLAEKDDLLSYVKKRKELVLLLNGNDFIEQKLKPSPRFSELLHTLACLQLDERIETKEEALDWLETQIKKEVP